jgi:hypothetical protein
MMSDQPSGQIRSYHRAFHFELYLHSLGNVRPWRPIPARGVFYTAASELVMIALARAPLVGRAVSGLGVEAVYGLVPVAVAWLLTVARIEGRRFHLATRVWARHLFSGAMLVGGYRKVKRPGTRWRPRHMVLVGDGRDGGAPSGLRLVGPGRVLLRYPCQARLEDARLTVAHTSQRPCDTGTVLTIAAGASVQFVGARHQGTAESPREEDTGAEGGSEAMTALAVAPVLGEQAAAGGPGGEASRARGGGG